MSQSKTNTNAKKPTACDNDTKRVFLEALQNINKCAEMILNTENKEHSNELSGKNNALDSASGEKAKNGGLKKKSVNQNSSNKDEKESAVKRIKKSSTQGQSKSEDTVTGKYEEEKSPNSSFMDDEDKSVASSFPSRRGSSVKVFITRHHFYGLPLQCIEQLEKDIEELSEEVRWKRRRVSDLNKKNFGTPQIENHSEDPYILIGSMLPLLTYCDNRHHQPTQALNELYFFQILYDNRFTCKEQVHKCDCFKRESKKKTR
ncbi:hypothetical protein QAD02_020832 [Eretmocerus hayati]|uniref:Uncharacterized protein n=1 Tax=Eretmocerus hayati TaxID=131215 RepID=A0ACC2PR15_9HYME|nr:hypothetical protein QAD02_020832 [Eretmocerus hayati]